jgi:hypothetical protein
VIGRARRIALAVLALSGLFVGAWALFAPHSFWTSFPGFGHHWTMAAGLYDEHLVTDVGAAYLALTALALLALRWGDRRVGQATGIVWTVFSGPHLYFHARHLDGLTGVDKVAELGSLTATLLIAVWLALPAGVGRATSPGFEAR